jgi:hypothetical protein
MDTLTPFQCFLIGGAASLAVCITLMIFIWRFVARLRRERPELFTEEARAARMAATRPRDSELLARIVQNQEDMLHLLREVLAERESPVR